MEQLDSIMMTGGPSDVPMGTPGMGGPPMGGPPPGPPPGPPMGEDPMMALMNNEAALGGGGMERGMEGGMSIEEDAGALAEAVVGRVEGNIEAAVAILDTAKAMLMASGGQDPMMEQPMMAADGRYLSDRDLAPLTQSGRSLSDRDLESLAMEAAISHSQTGRTISDKDLAPLTQSGRSLSDRDLAPLTQSGRSLSDRDLESLAMEAAISHSQTGRTISDKDLEFHRQMHSGRTMSDRDRSGRTMSERDTQGMSPDEKDEYFSEIIRMRRGN